MNKTAKKQTCLPIYLLGIVCALCLMVIFLITSVEAVAYWTPGYYEQEYTKYDVLDDLPEMTMDDLLDVTHEMMAFLRGNRDDLHVYSNIGGEYREFFNEREIAHMTDVRGLFIAGLGLRGICLAIVIVSFAGLAVWERRGKDKGRAALLQQTLPGALCAGTGAFFAIVLLLAALISTDFTKYFIIFHKIFFRNDLWILDPSTDLLINIVPEPFFMDTAARIALVFGGMTLIFLIGCLYLRAHYRNIHHLH